MIKPPFNKMVVNLRICAKISWQLSDVCVCVYKIKAFATLYYLFITHFNTHLFPLFWIPDFPYTPYFLKMQDFIPPWKKVKVGRPYSQIKDSKVSFPTLIL